jgi:hypothetical protein
MVSTWLKKEDNLVLLRFNLNCFNRDVISLCDNSLDYIELINNG